MISSLTVDDLALEVRWSPHRKTLGLTVDRGGELILSAPVGTDPAVLEEFVREKRFWIYTKLAEKEALRHPVSRKELVTGEGFPYLGRSYRLLLVTEQSAPLKLEQGRFKLLHSETRSGRNHFIRWYTGHARPWLEGRVSRLAPRVGVEPRGVTVRDLGFRWGSCGKARTLNFHWAAILLPPSVIEYIVIHELVHLLEANHTPAFWLRVERVMPDYENRKKWLAERGGAIVTL